MRIQTNKQTKNESADLNAVTAVVNSVRIDESAVKPAKETSNYDQ